jgi:hypothetical protein
LAISLRIKRLLVYGDSLLVVQQVNKEWDCDKETMEAYVQEVRKLENKFSGLEVHLVLREHNIAADALSKLGSTRAQVPAGVFVDELRHPSISPPPQVPTAIDSVQEREVMLAEEDWRIPFIDFIRDLVLPTGVDPRGADAARIMRRSKGFVLVADKLYRRGARTGVLMKCVTSAEGQDILREIHEGICGNHAASRTIVGKAYRAGFWWPTAVSDAEDSVRRCQNCQFFGKQSHVPAHNLITIPPSWPFACWSLDMIGPFTTAPGGFTHVLVAIDKFTKWIEYKPISKLTPDRVVDFISDILHHFGFPNTIITDLGSNFTAKQFWEFCDNSSIEVKYVSVAHPRANGQVERANGLIIDGLKKRLYDANTKKGGKWIHELPHVIWGLRTQPSKATGQTPFFLVYGFEAILPADIMWKSPRVEMYNEGEADEARQLELDSVEEARCSALVQLARYLQGVRRYHDRNTKGRSFNVGDLVLRCIQDEAGLHKLNSRWDGPFVVKKVTRPGSYRLQLPDGQDVPNSWNIQHLRRFYP